MRFRQFLALIVAAALASCSGGGGGNALVPSPQGAQGTGNSNSIAQVSIVDTGTLPGYDHESDAFGINNNAQVVGRVCCSTPYETAIQFSNGTLTNLGGLPGYSGSEAHAVNDTDVAVGVSCFPDNGAVLGKCHATEFSNGQTKDLGLLGGTGESSALAINSSGVAVGFASDGGTDRAVEFANGSVISLGDGVATGINDHGTIVGYTTNGLAVLFAPGCAEISLGSLGGGLSQAFAINKNGDIAGGSTLRTGSSDEHPFLYSQGKMHDLGLPAGGTSGSARAINDSGQVVGAYSPDGTQNRAFLYSGGVMEDLNSLLPANSGWVLNAANGINDNGVIVGTGTHNGAVRGFILTL